MKRLSAIMMICLGLAACHSSSPPLSKAEVPVPVTIDQSENDRLGERLIDTAARVVSEEVCMDSSKTPWTEFEQQRLDPASVPAGGNFSHQLIYVLCDPDPAHVIEGTLYRNVYRKGRLLHREPKPIYLKPGRWAIHALIGVPAKSRPGTYTLKTEFVGKVAGKRQIRLSDQIDFEVHE